jgi:hypothetical protein
MKDILIIHAGPFGYHTPTYYYCLLLKDKYRITYLGIDEYKGKKDIDGIRYIYTPLVKNRLAKKINYFKAIINELKETKYDFILLNYFIFCSIIKIFSNSSIALEIRTSFIFTNFFKRVIYNSILFIEARFFKTITTISHDLAQYLVLPSRTFIIPLGAPKFPSYRKDFSKLRVLYVGTFNGRDIPKTIYAVSKFVNDFKYEIDIVYRIIGFGSTEDMQLIKSLIKELGMDSYITYEGVIRYPELAKYFEICNVGMSYIPLKRRYDSQPPIKSFEYLLSGMAVLATGTKENKKIINPDNGVITGDSIEDIYEGLKKIYLLRNSFQSERIQKESQKYSWNSIVDNSLIPYIESF